MSASAILARTHHDGDCIIWDGAVQSSGYGSVGDGQGSTQLVHRVVFQAAVRPLAPEETIDHTCRRILCVNVAHLEPVSRSENSRRAHLARTHCKHGHSLSDGNVRLVARMDGHTRRVCLTCQRARNRSHMARVRAAVAS